MRYFANATAQKSRPAFPDGLGCTLGRLLGGSGTGAGLFSRNSQAPVHGVFCVLQIGAISKNNLISCLQSINSGLDLTGGSIVILQIGSEQAIQSDVISLSVLTVLISDSNHKIVDIDGQIVSTANSDCKRKLNRSITNGKLRCNILIRVFVIGTHNSLDLQNSDGTGTIAVQVLGIGLITAGEEFYATMRRSTNGGGENSPKLAGEDDFYELFFASLEEHI